MEDCINYSRASAGRSTSTVGTLMKLWGFYKGSGRLPHRRRIRGVFEDGSATATSCWTGRTGQLKLARRGVELDPGGIGKGYAVDKDRTGY